MNPNLIHNNKPHTVNIDTFCKASLRARTLFNSTPSLPITVNEPISEDAFESLLLAIEDPTFDADHYNCVSLIVTASAWCCPIIMSKVSAYILQFPDNTMALHSLIHANGLELSELEDNVANNFNSYLSHPEFSDIPPSTLFRIFKWKNPARPEPSVLFDLFLNILSKRGAPASILFSLLDFTTFTFDQVSTIMNIPQFDPVFIYDQLDPIFTREEEELTTMERETQNAVSDLPDMRTQIENIKLKMTSSEHQFNSTDYQLQYVKAGNAHSLELSSFENKMWSQLIKSATQERKKIQEAKKQAQQEVLQVKQAWTSNLSEYWTTHTDETVTEGEEL